LLFLISFLNFLPNLTNTFCTKILLSRKHLLAGYGIAEQVFVGGFGNFLSAYNFVITARVLLSWFPQAQGEL
jgi:hypothetical protein